MIIKLYVNDPAGKKCANNISIVSELKLDYSFDLEIIKKPEVDPSDLDSMPPFPSVVIDDEIIFKNKAVSIKKLEKEIKKRQ